MCAKSIMSVIDDQKWLDKAGEAIQPVILNAFKAGGKTGNEVKNFLHGKWLGHPLHPILTDIPIGAWTSAAVLDLIELTGNEKYSSSADASVVVGLAGAAGAAVTGLTDWTGTTQIERKAGLAHALLNISATALYLTSAILRRKGSRKTAISLSMLGYSITTLSAYIGGNLVYNQQLGVNHAVEPEGFPNDYVPVLPEESLKEGSMKCVRADKIDVLLAKTDGKIHAIANTCSHMGGPLSEGEIIDNDCVKCPWHGSVFSLKNGDVIDGPATAPQPDFLVRVKNGHIEVKLNRNPSRSFIPPDENA